MAQSSGHNRIFNCAPVGEYGEVKEKNAEGLLLQPDQHDGRDRNETHLKLKSDMMRSNEVSLTSWTNFVFGRLPRFT